MAISRDILTRLEENDPNLVSLDLSYKKLSEEDITKLLEILERKSNLNSLNLSGNFISEKNAKLLEVNTNLVTLTLIECGIDDIKAAYLAGNKTLHNLFLANNEISSKSARYFTTNQTLRNLSLLGNNIDDEGAIELAKNTTLQELNLAHNKISEKIFNIFENNKSLIALDLSYNNMQPLHLSALEKNSTIKRLYLAGNIVDYKDIESFVHANKALEVLDLSFCRVNDRSAIALAKHPGLYELNLGYNQITFEGANALSHNNTLKILKLSYNLVKDEGAVALSLNSTLTSLDLTGNQIGFEGANALRLNQTLTKLILSNNLLGDSGAIVLARNKTLQLLYLSYCGIKDPGAIALAENKTLKELVLNYNYITERGKYLLSKNTFYKLIISEEQPPEFTDENLATIFTLSESYLCITNKKGDIQFFNPAFSRTLSYSDDELLAKSMYDFIHPEDRDTYKDALLQEEKFPVKKLELRFICKDMSIIYVTFNLQIKYNRIYSMGINTTEQKKSDFEMSKMRESVFEEKIQATQNRIKQQTDLLGHLSHEILNPLSAAMGTIDLLRESHISLKKEISEVQSLMPADRGKKVCNEILAIQSMLEDLVISTDHLKNVLSDNLDLAKISSGKITFKKVNMNINKLIKEVFSIYHRKAEIKGLKIILILPDHDISAYGDITRIKQIIINLLANAIKFTDAGTIHITLKKIESETPDRINIQISITDQGIGLTQTEKSNIFDKYVQGSAIINYQYGGSGIGLHLSRELARAMGGDITVESEKHKGSTFTITLHLESPRPVEKLSPIPLVTSLSLFQKSYTLPGDKRIVLVVDDSEISRKIIIRFLQKINAECIDASNGEQAVELFQIYKDKIAIILMDINMPVMDGITATKAIRKIESDEGLDKTPVIAITAEAVNKEEITAVMDDIISKPFNINAFIETISRVLSKTEQTVSASVGLV